MPNFSLICQSLHKDFGERSCHLLLATSGIKLDRGNKAIKPRGFNNNLKNIKNALICIRIKELRRPTVDYITKIRVRHFTVRSQGGMA